MSYAEVLFNVPVNHAFTYKIKEDMEVRPGCRVNAPFGSRMITGFVTALREAPPEGVENLKEISRVIDEEPIYGQDTIDLALWVSRLYLCSQGEVLSSIIPGGKRPKKAERFFDSPPLPEKQFELAPQQKEALKRILESEDRFFYLNGVTGSGKTEVYLKTARHMLDRGRGVIYLVPEISLTQQALEAFLQEFGQEVAILHSGLTASQKLYEWLRIFRGEVQLVIGARSAVFAPVKDLGLIIIDEEHEGSYKSSNTPRYHARQVAMYRCKKEEALLILGSATPSLESWHQIKEGNLVALSMPRRLGGGHMPEIEIVDMKKEKSCLSKSLLNEIRLVHRQGRQTILFLNRRGFSYYFHCKSCGYEMQCRQCSVSLTFHKTKNKMICHYCGHREDPVQVCPQCSSLDVGYSGFGTEKIEEDLGNIFPEMRICRVDTDVTRQRFRLQEILTQFRAGEIDILLGTQMVAKGLNFPGVMLVGIISADTGLQLPDFRASERTFSLIVQVSGRAGRVIPDGKVIIQTLQPHNPAILLAAENKMEEFYENELAIREELEFPPFYRLIRLVFRGRNKPILFRQIKEYMSHLSREVTRHCQILGPVECPIAVIAGNYRYHVIFRTNQLNQVHSYIKQSLYDYRGRRDVYIEVDIDPLSLL